MPERMLCSYICHGGDHLKWSNWCFLMLGPFGFSWSSKITAIFTRLALRLLRSLQAWHFQPIPASAHLPTSLIRWNYVMSAYECQHITKLQKHRGNLTSDRNSVRQLTKTDIGSPWISCFMHCAFLMVCYSKCRIQIWANCDCCDVRQMVFKSHIGTTHFIHITMTNGVQYCTIHAQTISAKMKLASWTKWHSQFPLPGSSFVTQSWHVENSSLVI